MELNRCVANLILYAKKRLCLSELDAIYVGNLLYKEWGISSPYEGELDEKAIEAMARPDALWEELVSSLKESGVEAGEAEREATYAFGLLSPSPSLAERRFYELYQDCSPKEATSYLYDLGVKNGYIALSKIEKNIVFDASFKDEPSIEVTINLSKPEKNNQDIAKLLTKKENLDYPKCFLCKENLGYEGTSSHPARENLRFVGLNLDGEKWYLQYSPYGYFDEHCIVFSSSHSRMSVSQRIFSKLFAFVDLFPHYFIGCNSDLPIVGGSILDHEHFQGGGHMLPLLNASAKKLYPTPSHPHTRLETLDYYVSCLRLSGPDKAEILDLAGKILAKWRVHDDPSCGILHQEGEVRHNTITSLVKKVDETYYLFLILRNNRTDESYPDGIYHAHPEYFHIKKEGIGLIEAAGRFILPARLVRQSKLIEDGLAKGQSNEEIIAANPELGDFTRMMDALRGGQSLHGYLGDVCQGILKNVAVYKDTPEGEKGLERFLQSIEL